MAAAASRRGATPVQALFLWVRAKGVVIVTCVLRLPPSRLPSLRWPIARARPSRTWRSTLQSATLVSTSHLPPRVVQQLTPGLAEPLTVEEVAAIDEAGKDGPPPITAVMMVRRQLAVLARRRVAVHMILAIIMLTLGWKTGWLMVMAYKN